MIYPEPVGARLMHQPTKQQIARILDKAQPRIVGEGFRSERRAAPGELFALYCAEIHKHGGWITVEQLADGLDIGRPHALNQLAGLVRRNKLLKRFRPDGTREYGLP